MKLEFSLQICEKDSNTKFHKNPSCVSRVIPRRQADMMKLKVIFRNFANTPKSSNYCRVCVALTVMQTGHDVMWDSSSLVFNGYRNSSLGVKQPKCEVTTQLYQVPRLRMQFILHCCHFFPCSGQGETYLCPVYTSTVSLRFCYKTEIEDLWTTEILNIGRKRHLQ
jgi:hypothetical protein